MIAYAYKNEVGCFGVFKLFGFDCAFISA